MKSNKKIISLFVTILVCGIVSSCATIKNYRIMQQNPVESDVIKAATEFKVKPIDFSLIKPLDLGYANVEEWKADLEPVPKAFAGAFLELSEEARQYTQRQNELYGNAFPRKTNIFNKKVIMIKKDEPVASGIVVNVVVKNIILKWNYFNEKPDEFLCNVTFTDAASGQELFSGAVNVNNRQEMAYVGGGGARFAVGPGLSFSGRLQAMAYNMAEMLTEIMSNGKTD